jgi:hypothetical protein
LLEATCLKTSYTLRKQILLSFGGAAVVTIIVVVIVSCIAVREAGEMVIDAGGELLSNQTLRKLSSTAGLITHLIANEQNMNEGAIELAVNFVRDRSI